MKYAKKNFNIAHVPIVEEEYNHISCQACASDHRISISKQHCETIKLRAERGMVCERRTTLAGGCLAGAPCLPAGCRLRSLVGRRRCRFLQRRHVLTREDEEGWASFRVTAAGNLHGQNKNY